MSEAFTSSSTQEETESETPGVCVSNASSLRGRAMSPAAAFVLIGLASCLFFLPYLGIADLSGADEPRTAAIAAEMAATGNVAVPRLNGFAFLEKPPLFFAVCAASLRLFGRQSAFALRLPGALCSVATVLLCGFIAFWAYRSVLAALLSAVMLGTSYGFWANAFEIRVDVMMTMFITAALVCFYLWLDSRGSRRLMCEMGMALSVSCAVMTKNLVGLALPCVAMGGVLIARRDFRLRTWLALVIVYTIPVLAWVGWMWSLYRQLGPDAVRDAAWINTIGRFTGSRPAHAGPIYFYIPAVLGKLLPWSLFLLGALYGMGRRWKTARAVASRDAVVLLSVVGPFVLLSLSAGKREIYCLPLLPALSAFTGGWVAGVLGGRAQERSRWFALSIWGALILATALPLAVMVALVYYNVSEGLIACAAIGALAGAAVLVYAIKSAEPRRRIFAMLAVQTLGLLEAGLLIWPIHNMQDNLRPAVEMLNPYLQKGTQVYLLSCRERIIGAARFYLDRELPMLLTDGDYQRFIRSAVPAVALTGGRTAKRLRIADECVLNVYKTKTMKPVMLVANPAFLSAHTGRASQRRRESGIPHGSLSPLYCGQAGEASRRSCAHVLGRIRYRLL